MLGFSSLIATRLTAAEPKYFLDREKLNCGIHEFRILRHSVFLRHKHDTQRPSFCFRGACTSFISPRLATAYFMMRG